MDLSKAWELTKSLMSYLLFTTTYSHIFVIYSFCNIDDCSWGTKGLDSE